MAQETETVPLHERPCPDRLDYQGDPDDGWATGCRTCGGTKYQFPGLGRECSDLDCYRGKILWTGAPYLPAGDTQYITCPTCSGTSIVANYTVAGLLEAMLKLNGSVDLLLRDSGQYWVVYCGVQYEGDTLEAALKAALEGALDGR